MTTHSSILREAKKYVGLFWVDDDDTLHTVGSKFYDVLDDVRPVLLSVAKWYVMVKEDLEFDGASSTCALCLAHLVGDKCYGCPIFEDTGQHLCKGTPYEYFSVFGDQAKGLNFFARRELMYLIDLAGRIHEQE